MKEFGITGKHEPEICAVSGRRLANRPSKSVHMGDGTYYSVLSSVTLTDKDRKMLKEMAKAFRLAYNKKNSPAVSSTSSDRKGVEK